MKDPFERDILKYCSRNNINLDRVHLPRFDDFEITSVTAGVGFVYTPSSGPSLQSLRLFLSILGKAQLDISSLELFFFNSELPEFSRLASRLNIDSQGYGELFWISNGKIIHSDRGTKTDNREQQIIKLVEIVHSPPQPLDTPQPYE